MHRLTLRRLCVLLVALSTVAAAPAVAQTGGPDAFGYRYFPATYDFVALENQTGAVSTSLAGSGAETVSLPFGFPFYGNTYNAVRIGAEGAISFDTGAGIPASNGCLPSTASGSPDISIFWDDLNPQVSEIRTWHDAANDRVIISWENLLCSTVTCQ